MGWIADLLKEIPSAARYKSELEAMEKQNGLLKLENENLRNELERRDQEAKSQDSRNGRLEETREHLLQLLGTNSDITEEQIARAMEINVQVISFHLTELEKSRFVHGSYSAVYDTKWSIAHDGRGYLIRHGLLA
ncbi:hypothetical protein [Limnobacter sp.]|uniref:hypothetical protein n=1 Tax=Limnobacter sp. TaxID=2003368 RepID=UPI003BA89560